MKLDQLAWCRTTSRRRKESESSEVHHLETFTPNRSSSRPGPMARMEISDVLAFCFGAFTYVPPDNRGVLFAKSNQLNIKLAEHNVTQGSLDAVKQHLSPEEWQIVEILRSRRMIPEDPFNVDSFTLDTMDKLAPNMDCGKLGLVKTKRSKLDANHFYSPSFLDGKVPGVKDRSIHQQYWQMGEWNSTLKVTRFE